jgi:hypothetical protein
MKITFTKDQYTKYNRLWKEDLENDTETRDEYQEELVNNLIENHTVEDIEDEFERCFDSRRHYTFKQTGEKDRLRYKCGIIVNVNLSNI